MNAEAAKPAGAGAWTGAWRELGVPKSEHERVEEKNLNLFVIGIIYLYMLLDIHEKDDLDEQRGRVCILYYIQVLF